MSRLSLYLRRLSQGQYVHHKEVKASLGIKIVAPDLEKAIAGSRLLVIGEDDDEDELREDIMSDLTDLMNSVDKSGRGVCVQASTLGSLEALLEFLRTSKIPVRFFRFSTACATLTSLAGFRNQHRTSSSQGCYARRVNAREGKGARRYPLL